jgi:hypothetical protein
MKTCNRVLFLSAVFGAAAFAQGRRPPQPPTPRMLPEGPGRELVQRACGSTCHAGEVVAGKGYTREAWATVVNGMISRGAKVSASEFTGIVDYLGKNLPPRTVHRRGPG